MKSKELRQKVQEMSVEELAAKEHDLRENLFKLSFQHGIHRLENTATLRNLRRDIARVLTAKNARQGQ